MNWAAHLEHLQTILQEFDAHVVILKPVLIRLFCNGLWPFIHAQAKQNTYRKDTWEQAIKKSITAEAKAALNLPTWVWEMDVCYPWGHQSFPKADEHTKEKVSNQNSSRSQEPRPQLSQCFKNIETLDPPWKNHKNNRRNRRGCCNCGHWGQHNQFFGSE